MSKARVDQRTLYIKEINELKEEVREWKKEFQEETDKHEMEIDDLADRVNDRDLEIEQLEQDKQELTWEIEDLNATVLEMKEDPMIERLILKIEHLDPKFNRDLDLTNNYLPRIY